MVKKRGLNRGLEALLQGAGSLDVDLTQDQPKAKDGLQELPVEWVQRGVYQPRIDMDPEALEELAASIRAHGIMQPIVVRSVGIDRYEIIAPGPTRREAARPQRRHPTHNLPTGASQDWTRSESRQQILRWATTRGPNRPRLGSAGCT